MWKKSRVLNAGVGEMSGHQETKLGLGPTDETPSTEPQLEGRERVETQLGYGLSQAELPSTTGSESSSPPKRARYVSDAGPVVYYQSVSFWEKWNERAWSSCTTRWIILGLLFALPSFIVLLIFLLW